MNMKKNSEMPALIFVLTTEPEIITIEMFKNYCKLKMNCFRYEGDWDQLTYPLRIMRSGEKVPFYSIYLVSNGENED